jgi:VanZ family protein
MREKRAERVRRMIPSLVWLVAMYTATGLSEAAPPLALVEAQRIALHTAGYAVLGLLMARAFHPRPARIALGLLGLALVAGLGQEVLQSMARGHVYLSPSLFDLGVDGVGAALGLWIVARWRRGRDASRRAPTGTSITKRRETRT